MGQSLEIGIGYHIFYKDDLLFKGSIMHKLPREVSRKSWCLLTMEFVFGKKSKIL